MSKTQEVVIKVRLRRKIGLCRPGVGVELGSECLGRRKSKIEIHYTTHSRDS